MTKIRNLNQLRAEKLRLQAQSSKQRTQIKSTIEDLKVNLQPIHLLFEGIANLTGIHIEKNAYLKDGIAFGLSLIVQQYFLKAEQKIEEKLHAVSSSLVEKVKSFAKSLIDKVEVPTKDSPPTKE